MPIFSPGGRSNCRDSASEGGVMLRSLIVLVLSMVAMSPAIARAADLDGWQLVQAAEQERLAVFCSPGGELQMLKPGDRLGERLVFTGFDGGQVVLEKPGEWGRVTFFVRLVDGRQVIASRERQPLRKFEFSSLSDGVEGAVQEGAVDRR